MLSKINPYIVSLIVLVFVLIIVGIFSSRIYRRFIEFISSWMTVLKMLAGGNGVVNVTGNDEVDKAIGAAGYSYDMKQDMFYSRMDAWQREMGYCRLYDEVAAPCGMIIDCEPINFEYDGKKWLIEFWKGQYDLTTGCEIGIYKAVGPDLDIQGFFNGTFYNCVSDEERLQMEFILKKKGETLFTRKGKHWWLTGFILGEFSEPSDLTMDIAITLKDSIMRDAFLIGLKNAGYSEKEITIKGNKVSLEFNHTRTAQPISRIRETDEIIQSKNKFLCDNYRNITANYDNLSDKIMAIREQSPGLYVRIINIGKDKNIFRSYRVIKKYLN